MRIYVASSWRNQYQDIVVRCLRYSTDHHVYDFRNPAPGEHGFAWTDLEGKAAGMRVDGKWQDWTSAEFKAALDLPRAIDGFNSDMDALRACDVCILVLPCGRSAHLELGWAVGAGKRTAIYIPSGEHVEPELMYRMVDRICLSMYEMFDWVAHA